MENTAERRSMQSNVNMQYIKTTGGNQQLRDMNTKLCLSFNSSTCSSTIILSRTTLESFSAALSVI